MPNPEVESIITHKRMRLHAIEAQYLRTKEYLKSPAWGTKRDELLTRLSHTIGMYKYGQDATAAVFVLGQAKQLLLEIQEVTDVIVEFEALQEELRRYNDRT